ncbi:GntR family transcriptional regulator [Roseibium porphyridii]|uniref:GntR family transcriptional regulator n=1 Tax=Roseibium porphyridii TaxID=2866279 RepID=A0ABY8F5R7_9HYPH|nr:GntR family transcriptional regulator [Roseibium sp. KMA01]WFE90837.1 GntR family transcriptional regulator [Roseibium sp. KMA01]
MSSRAKATRVDSAYDRLKSDILTGMLPPGFQAPEPEVASRLGMSRTPVREALIRLEADGLVELIPRRGARVIPVTGNDICEVFEILSVLEALAAQRAGENDASQEVLTEIEAVSDEADQALAAKDIDAWAQLDDKFHRLIAQASGNNRLEAEINGFLDQVLRANTVLLRLNQAPASCAADHRKLTAAIKSGEGGAAWEIARSHRLNGLKTMRKLLQDCGLTQV